MVNEDFNVAPKNSVEWFEVEIPIRGCVFSLKQIQLAYSELNQITQMECERTIAELKKPAEQSDADWATGGALVGLMLYRLLYSYLRWAFPVNVLKENKDTATKHRAFFAAIITSMIVHLLLHVFDKLPPI